MTAASTGAPKFDVVVCIPTYRRVPQLVALLRALANQRPGKPFGILIGNNDRSDLAALLRERPETLPACDVIQVATRGVTAVRNAMIARVLAEGEAVRWIACLDDDQIPAHDWLEKILSAAVRFDADLVGGPVHKIPTVETFWARGAADTSYLPAAEGPTATLNEAGNLLLSTRFLRTLGRPPFSTDFGRTGGEDYEFFLHALSRNARIVWAPAAVVSEALPGDRLTFRGFVWRFYSIAAYQVRADLAYQRRGTVLARAGWQLAKSPAVLARSLVRDRDPAIALGIVLRSVATAAGRVVGFVGVRAERYGSDPVSSGKR